MRRNCMPDDRRTLAPCVSTTSAGTRTWPLTTSPGGRGPITSPRGSPWSSTTCTACTGSRATWRPSFRDGSSTTPPAAASCRPSATGSWSGARRRGPRVDRARAAAPQPLLAQGGRRRHRRAGGGGQRGRGLPGHGARRRLQPAPPRALPAAGPRQRRRVGRPADQAGSVRRPARGGRRGRGGVRAGAGARAQSADGRRRGRDPHLRHARPHLRAAGVVGRRQEHPRQRSGRGRGAAHARRARGRLERPPHHHPPRARAGAGRRPAARHAGHARAAALGRRRRGGADLRGRRAARRVLPLHRLPSSRRAAVRGEDRGGRRRVAGRAPRQLPGAAGRTGPPGAAAGRAGADRGQAPRAGLAPRRCARACG